MFREEVPRAPLWAWIFVAVSAPIARLAGGSAWPGVLILSLLCGCLCWGIHMLCPDAAQWQRWYCLMQFLFLLPAAGEMARLAENCWPTGGSFPVVPITLVVLAAANAWNGAARASRVGGVLFWLLALLYCLVLFSGVQDVRPEWLAPRMDLPKPLLAVALLLPGAAAMLPKSGGRGAAGWGLALIFGFSLLLSLLVSGNLSPAVAASSPDPFYAFSKSLSFLGVAERFEAFVSVALTMSYFGMLSLLFALGGFLLESVHPRWGRAGVLLCALGSMLLLLAPPVPEIVLAVGAAVLWLGLPLLQGTFMKIKAKKPEKGT